MLDINLKGTIWCSQAAARAHDRDRAGGSIVHIASVGAFAAQELASIYCASKAAQVSLAQSMAIELAPHGIRVNAVAPGDILTPANAEVVADLKAGARASICGVRRSGGAALRRKLARLSRFW